MILMILWALGYAILTWVIVAHGLWRDMLPLMASVAWLLWLFGGIAGVALRSRRIKGATTREGAWEQAAAAATARAEAERRRREDVK